MTGRGFDAEFYRRFYVNPRTRVTTAAEMQRRAAALAALVRHLQIPVSKILDAGCGLGWMRPALVRAFPRARYVGIEVSAHLCEKFGWTQASLASYRPHGRFDLIICHDVMQYLPETQARRALANLGRLCRGALYFHAPTREDWRRHADRSCSDGNIHLRSADWYRSRLERSFRHAGFGLYVRRGVPITLWELERLS
jgi:SAM-dependent methyltransferase